MDIRFTVTDMSGKKVLTQSGTEEAIAKISGEGIEKLLKTQGILLEHDTHNSLLNIFTDNGFTQDDTQKRLVKNSVSYYLYSNDKKTNIEVDVYFEIQQYFNSINFWEGSSEESSEIITQRFGITTYLLIQCKGHPSNGFLLCRKKEIETPYWEPFQEPSEFGSNYNYIKRDNTIFVDWANFYKVNEGETKKRSDNVTVYQEDKAKFYNGARQIDDSIAALYQMKQLPIQKNRASAIYRNVRIIPMMVTNCQILLMSILEKKVIIRSVPYVLYTNKTDYDSNRIKDFNYYHIVNFRYLNLFIEIMIDPEKNFAELYSNGRIRKVHTFNR